MPGNLAVIFSGFAECPIASIERARPAIGLQELAGLVSHPSVLVRQVSIAQNGSFEISKPLFRVSRGNSKAAAAIARELKISLDELAGLSSNADPELSRLIYRLEELNEQDRAMARRFLGLLLGE